MKELRENYGESGIYVYIGIRRRCFIKNSGPKIPNETFNLAADIKKAP